jgi:hypothetical protein
MSMENIGVCMVGRIWEAAVSCKKPGLKRRETA